MNSPDATLEESKRSLGRLAACRPKPAADKQFPSTDKTTDHSANLRRRFTRHANHCVPPRCSPVRNANNTRLGLEKNRPMPKTATTGYNVARQHVESPQTAERDSVKKRQKPYAKVLGH